MKLCFAPDTCIGAGFKSDDLYAAILDYMICCGHAESFKVHTRIVVTQGFPESVF